MPEQLTSFQSYIAPFSSLWGKLRISSAVVRRNDCWISLATRIALSHKGSEDDFLIQPCSDFMAFGSDMPLAKLEELVISFSNGSAEINVAGKNIKVFLTVAHANQEPSAPDVHLGSTYSICGQEQDRNLEFGRINIRIHCHSTENQSRFLTGDQLNIISSKLRIHDPSFNGVAELLTHLDLPFNISQSYCYFEVAAILPFGMSFNHNTVNVTGPYEALKNIRVIGFFDTGRNEIKPNESAPSQNSEMASSAGPVIWPEKSKSGRLFLYFGDEVIASIPVRRWLGTQNWRTQVQEFFDPGRINLKAGLEAKTKPRDFETAVVRLLNELRLPTIWYGGNQYHNRSDLAACAEFKNEWVVLLGECTVQKPSEKFIQLISRKQELTKMLQGDVRVMPAVFTNSTLSSSDKAQARQDGISLVGANELIELLNGIDYEWSPAHTIKYFESLLTARFEHPFRIRS